VHLKTPIVPFDKLGAEDVLYVGTRVSKDARKYIEAPSML
jgi:hypothetical protein